MRLFAGLDLPTATVVKLEELVERLRPSARIAWSPPANLHITTKFIGEWPEERLPELKGALSEAAVRAPIRVRVAGTGFYPGGRSARVFFAAIDAPDLPPLAAATDGATARLGIEPEKRAYSPHLTLARIRDRIDLRPLQTAVDALDPLDFGSFTAASFFLYRSQLRPTGSVYTKLAEYPFSQQ